MQISSNMTQANPVANENGIKKVFTEKLTNDQISELKAEVQRSTNAYTFKENAVQHNIFGVQDNFTKEYEGFTSFLKDIGYEGKPIAELSQSEAAELVSEDGIFGIKQTSERIANFVINGSGGDEDMMRAGREGMIEGFKEAEELWGGELPEISQQTMQKSIEMVDKAMHDLGYSILNSEA
ncbi:hypothetical protein [Sulfurimonas sp.]|jgi:hypothetical protein|uniref:hypothetical protein n=1 Tax=Sulfurimonas sp. TaxID=2022749 RepID=UPI0025CC5159|nr:hypothetical protein [Sulfurimonas sp.]MBT5933752.1 hypothetical protein [Sulfurimonas sp.]